MRMETVQLELKIWHFKMEELKVETLRWVCKANPVLHTSLVHKTRFTNCWWASALISTRRSSGGRIPFEMISLETVSQDDGCEFEPSLIRTHNCWWDFHSFSLGRIGKHDIDVFSISIDSVQPGTSRWLSTVFDGIRLANWASFRLFNRL